jgi:hypothetical protein
MSSSPSNQQHEEQRRTAQQDAVPFPKRKWTEASTLSLVCAWEIVYKEGSPKDETTVMTNTRIYDAFMASCPSSTRSKKAVEDKLQALREMYRFIRDVNTNRIAGSTGKPEWFDLSKQEKKELRYVVKGKSAEL